jgi:rhodanese-related sulfurtransferase
LKYLLSIFLSITFLFSYEDDIDATEAFELQKDGAFIIDVRTPSEFIHVGHGLGHINIPVLYQKYTPKSMKVRENFANMESKNHKGYNSRKLYKTKIEDNSNFFKEVLELTGGDFESDIVILCHSGERSKYAAEVLSKKGFESVYNLDGGFLDWKKEGKPFSVD